MLLGTVRACVAPSHRPRYTNPHALQELFPQAGGKPQRANTCRIGWATSGAHSLELADVLLSVSYEFERARELPRENTKLHAYVRAAYRGTTSIFHYQLIRSKCSRDCPSA